MFALANIETLLGAGISAPLARTISITNAWYKGKVCWYPLIKEGQRSHKYALKRANGVTSLHFGASLWVPP